MARARNIKPGFFRNADLAELTFEARLLFIGLWTLADREGRLPDRPKQIKIETFPADNLDCNALIQSIADTGMLLRYQVGSDRFLQIVNFCKHQNPHRDEKASVIPAPGLPDVKPIQHGASTVQAPCNSGASTVPIGLNPDSLIPDPRFPDGEAHAPPDPAPEPPAMDRGAPDGAARVDPDSASPPGQKPEQPSPAGREPPPTPPPRPPDGPLPTAAAVACRAMRAAGLASVNPSSPELAALIDAGATADVLADAAARAVGLGKGFAYALGMVRGQMADAARVAAAVAGAGLVPPARASPPEPAWRAEQRQRTLQAVPGIAAKNLATPPKNFIETGAEHVVAIAVG